MLQTLANFSIEGTSPEQIILALTNLEKVGRHFPAGQVGQALAPYFNSEYFLVQVKAFLTLGRIGQAADCKVPFSFWQEYRQQPAWQLQALDAFWQIPDDAKTKTSILLSQLEQEQHPTTLRGLVWLLGQSESPLAVVGLGFFLASKRQRQVKDEVLHEAWFTLAQRFPAEAEKVVKNMPDLALWLRHRVWRQKTLYHLYPAPDYLWQVAKKQGVRQEDFRRLYYRPRQKTKALIAGKRNATESLSTSC